MSLSPGWHPDPTGRFEIRYWNGTLWTEHVGRAGVQTVDPLAEPASALAGAPASGTSGAPARVPFFGARKFAERAQLENMRLRGLIEKHGLQDIADLDAVRDDLAGDIARARSQLDVIHEATREAQTERDQIAYAIVSMRAELEVQEFGLYDYEHPAEPAVSLASELEALRQEIKHAIRAGRATSATSSFTFNNSAAKGAKFVRDMSKLMLRSYNAEAENCVKSVRAGNLASAQKRLSTAVDQVARLGTMIQLQITPYFHALRLRELELASRHLQALQAERELERARREELRQQRLAEQELAKEKARLEKERSHYTNVIDALFAKGDLEGAERMRNELADVERALADVDYRQANIRAGYVYVISNIGSFGPDVVKIGMTRRLEPMDRVNELGDASVPFRFDVHAMFFAEDAVAIESMLHQHFADRRLNRVNLRREYFRATPSEVLDALREHNVEVVEFTLEAAAAEFRSSTAD